MEIITLDHEVYKDLVNKIDRIEQSETPTKEKTSQEQPEVKEQQQNERQQTEQQ